MNWRIINISKKFIYVTLFLLVVYSTLLHRLHMIIFYGMALFLLWILLKQFDEIKKTESESTLLFSLLVAFMFYATLRLIIIFFPKDLPQMGNLNMLASFWNVDLVNLFSIMLYVIFTYYMFSEMRKTRQQVENPNIIVKPEQHGTWSAVYLTIRNIGQSEALDIETRYSIMDNDDNKKEFFWAHSIMQPLDYVHLNIGNNWFVNFLKENKKIIFNAIYYNNKGQKFKKNLVFDCKKLLKGIEDVQWIIETDYAYESNKKLEEISKSLNNIDNYLKYLSYDAQENYNKKRNKKMKEFLTKRKKSQSIKKS